MWGDLWQMGNFDECVNAERHLQMADHLPGTAFCLASLQLQMGAEGDDSHLRGSAWDAIKVVNFTDGKSSFTFPVHPNQQTKSKIIWYLNPWPSISASRRSTGCRLGAT